MEKRPILTISLLASKKIDDVRRCLDSIVPIMEKIPSELILTDTSGDPEVHALLLKYTPNVVEFTWCNDFAKARNVGLKMAKGEWFLFLDDDEWFVEYDELVRFFQNSEYKKYGCANYIQRNFTNPQGTMYTDTWVSRMIKLEPETEFRSKIHEYLFPPKGNCKYLNAVVNHTGYVFDTPESKRAHFERNAPLLLEMIEEEPEDLRWKVQLVQEYCSVKEWEKLYEFCRNCLEETKDLTKKYDCYNIGTFYSGAAEALVYLYRYEDALALYERALQDRRLSPLCLAHMALYGGLIHYRLGNYDTSETCVRGYFAYKTELEKDPMELNDQMMALLVGSAFDRISTLRAYSILICDGLRSHSIKNLETYYEKLEWEQDSVYLFDGMLEALTDAAADFADHPVYVKVMRLLQSHEEVRRLVQEQIRKKGEAFYLAVPYDLWTEGLDRYMDENGVLSLLEVDHELSEIKTKEDIRYAYVSMRASEIVLLFGWNGKKVEEIRALLSMFSEKTSEFFETYFQKDIMEQHLELLPEYAQAAIRIRSALSLEDGDFAQATECWKEAAACYPELGAPIKKYLQGFSELQLKRQLEAKDEMRKLKLQIREQVAKCVGQGQYGQALAILDELKQMQPNDLDLAEDTLRVRLLSLGVK